MSTLLESARILNRRKKKNMGEHSLRLLIAKFVPFITFLLLWQLGFGDPEQENLGYGDSNRGSSGDSGIGKSTGGTLEPRKQGPCGNYVNSYCIGNGKGQPRSVYERNLTDFPSNRCNEDDGLPCNEVDALQTVLISLGVLPAPSITRSYCQNRDSFITCNCPGNVCHITAMKMGGQRLSGFIHPDVSGLKYLTTLDLSSNNLGRDIHPNLGDLSNLITLNLFGNRLTGPIPERLGKLQSLTELTLKMNFLSGHIPPSLGSLSSLLTLDLWSNNLIGRIPNELGNLSKLVTLRLDDNQLTGPLPAELGKLSNLAELWLTSNNLYGPLEDGNFSQLYGLRSFAVGGNYLSGPIPNYFKNWKNLKILNLLGNSLEGGLPKEIFSMTSLQYLWVSDLNNSSFSIPDTANLTNIYSLILRNCSIYGPIPKSLYTWSWLTHLDLSFNRLTGEIPIEQNLTSLNEMYLTRNMLTGTIPDWIYYRQIKGDLSYNYFTVPKNRNRDKRDMRHMQMPPNKNIINMPSLDQTREKNCSGSKFKYNSLFINSGGEEAVVDGYRYHSDNATSNYYESQEGNWAYSCSGDFMSSKATAHDYTKNVTCGISVSEDNLYKNARLCPRSLTYYGFCLQNGNYTVQLHFAEIVYAKDEDHSSVGKRVFDVYIQGERKLQDFNIKEKAGDANKNWNESFDTSVHNNQLEIHFFWAGKGSLYNPPALNGPLISAISVTPKFKAEAKAEAISAWMIAVITVGSVFALLLLLALLRRMGLVGNKELHEKKIQIRGTYYSLKQVMYATQKFSLKIGEGHFGEVYKAELPGEQIVAVKKLSAHWRQVIDQIGNEVFAQKILKQENLVELLASYSGNGLHLLIYEYMENKSLKEALFDSTAVLPWEDRYNICLGVANGLKYLHERTPSVIHRNIKATNVLLDGTLKAKIADFGLAMLYKEENPFRVNGEEGALVYMAPEYVTRRAISNKIDVYSFGVVVLEIVSGTNNAEYHDEQETVFLVDSACVSKTKGLLLDLVDRNLSSYNRGQAIIVLNLAMMCIDQSPTLRPTMSEVVDVLESKKTIEEISKVVITPKA